MEERKHLFDSLIGLRSTRRHIEKSLAAVEKDSPLEIFIRGDVLNDLCELEKVITQAIIEMIESRVPKLEKDQGLIQRDEEIRFIDFLLHEIEGREDMGSEIRRLKDLREKIGLNGVRPVFKKTDDK